MSLKAIAKELGISVTTVSRALNGYDDVSQETRARVEAEAQRRGYRRKYLADIHGAWRPKPSAVDIGQILSPAA